jgi:hypothetical protein
VSDNREPGEATAVGSRSIVSDGRRFVWGRNARLPTSAIDLQGDRGCTRRGGVTAAKVAVYAHA